MSYSFILFLAVLALLIPVSALTLTYAAIPTREYPTIGTQATTNVINKVINMHGNTQLNLIATATGGNFNSKNLVIAVSVDNSTFITVDTIGLSTSTSKALNYSDANTATTLPVNPAGFPFVKVTTSGNVTSVTQTLYWVANP